MNDLLSQIESLLKGASDRDAAFGRVLQLALAHFHSETGTIHVLDPDKQILHLVAQSGLPPALLDVVKEIPVGKGIAGQTVARGGPVTICNLQTDPTGVARPAARQTGVGGALCVPLHLGHTIVGTIGIGTIRPHEYSPDETKLLEYVGQVIARYVGSSSPATNGGRAAT